MHINSSSGTRDGRTDADNAEIKFMFSSERFTLAMAMACDLGALLPRPSFLCLHERPNTKAKAFLQLCRKVSPFLSPICAFALDMYLPLSVRPVKTCGFSYLLSVSAISSFPYSVGPRENCQQLCVCVWLMIQGLHTAAVCNLKHPLS